MMFRSDAQRRAVFSRFSKKNVTRGDRFERKIKNRLADSDSIVTVRSAGSRGLWDVVSITPNKVRIIQAKTKGYLTPNERKRMMHDIKLMPDNVQAEVEYYVSPKVRTNKTVKKAGETDWDKVEERLDYFAKVRGCSSSDVDCEFSRADDIAVVEAGIAKLDNLNIKPQDLEGMKLLLGSLKRQNEIQ